MTATPLFVVGTARSGTTWLANLLASHPDIAGVAAAVHEGVMESHLLDHTRFALPGEWTREAFAERYAAEDYAKLAAVAPEEFCAAAPPRGDAVTFFGVLMELVAAKAGARYWLEKTPKHAIYADLLLRRFAGARFVIIEREFVATVQSQVALFANARAGRLRQRMEKVARYASDARAIRRLRHRASGRTVTVSYEALARDTEGETGRVLRFLDLPPRSLVSAHSVASAFGGTAPGGPRPRAASACCWRRPASSAAPCRSH